jgi:hypothetical protein
VGLGSSWLPRLASWLQQLGLLEDLLIINLRIFIKWKDVAIWNGISVIAKQINHTFFDS